MGDRPAAGAEGGDRQHRRADILPRDAPRIGLLDAPPGDHRDIGRGAAHVEGDHVGAAHQRAQRPSRHRARRRPRQERLVGEAGAEPDPHQPAMRLHQEELRGFDPRVRQRRAEAQEVAFDPGADIGVDRGGGQPGVFADRRQDVGRQRDPEPGRLLGDDLGGAALMGRVAEAEQVADGHRLDARPGERAHRFAQLVLVERGQHRAPVVEAFDRLGGARLRHQQAGLAVERVEQVVRVGLRPAARLVDRAEPLGDQQPGARPVLLDQRVGGDRRAVHQEADLGRRDAGGEQLVQRIDHRARGIVRHRRHLDRAALPGRGAIRDQVGERPPGIDPHHPARHEARSPAVTWHSCAPRPGVNTPPHSSCRRRPQIRNRHAHSRKRHLFCRRAGRNVWRCAGRSNGRAGRKGLPFPVVAGSCRSVAPACAPPAPDRRTG